MYIASLRSNTATLQKTIMVAPNPLDQGLGPSPNYTLISQSLH